MTKVFEFLDKYAVRIILTEILLIGILLGCNYVSTIKTDMQSSFNKMENYFLTQVEVSEKQANLTIKGLLLIIEQLEDIANSQQYIIDQNRTTIDVNKKQTEVVEKNSQSPSYEELKSHTVYIVGCSNKVLSDETKIHYMLETEGVCWAGTGSVIKITDTETYILTNNHVAGKDELNVSLYVQNGESKTPAEVVKYHDYVDLAVIKIKGRIEGKTEIPGYAIAKIQEKVYVVGNPLGNKMTYSEGVVANFLTTDLLIQAPLIYGNSGSAIINQEGKLVGVCYALQTYPYIFGIPAPQITHSLCVDTISIIPFLKDLGLYNEKE